MFGLIGGLFLACATFYLVIAKFDTRVWVAALSSLVVWVACGFTGIFGCLIFALAIGVLYQTDF